METISKEQETNQNPEQDSKKVIGNVISKLEKNDFSIYIYCPAMNAPSGGISVLFKHAKVLKDAGYNVKIVYEPQQNHKASLAATQKARQKGSKDNIIIFDKFNPSWLGELGKDIETRCLAEGTVPFSDGTEETYGKLLMNPEDFMLIPEGFPNVMENTANLPCKRVVLAQSWYYILGGLKIGQKWQHFGIKDVISVSDGITEYLDTVMPGLSIKNYKQSIDKELFQEPENISDKSPMIVYMPGRGPEAQMKTSNVIRTFYEFFPHYRWVRFSALQGLSKEDFASQLKTAAFALYTDEVAGFGTLPLEAMACGTHVIGWTPFGSKEYINENNGFWAVNGDIFQLAELIGFALDRYFAGVLDKPEVKEQYQQTLAPYTADAEVETIKNIYKEYTNERIEELKAIQ